MTAAFVPMWILGAGFVGLIVMPTLFSAGHTLAEGYIVETVKFPGMSYPTTARTHTRLEPRSGTVRF